MLDLTRIQNTITRYENMEGEYLIKHILDLLNSHKLYVDPKAVKEVEISDRVRFDTGNITHKKIIKDIIDFAKYHMIDRNYGDFRKIKSALAVLIQKEEEKYEEHLDKDKEMININLANLNEVKELYDKLNIEERLKQYKDLQSFAKRNYPDMEIPTNENLSGGTKKAQQQRRRRAGTKKVQKQKKQQRKSHTRKRRN